MFDDKMIETIKKVVFAELEKRGLMDESNELTDKEVEMLMTQLKSIMINSKDIATLIMETRHAPAWAESKIANASSMMAKLRSYMMAESSK